MSPSLLDRIQKARGSIPPCTPPFWAKSGHAQTLLGHLLPSRVPELGGTELRIPLESPHEVLSSTLIRGTVPGVVYLFHGLGGSTEAGYMRRSALSAKNLGYSVFLNNHRGCGSGMGLATEPYHSGRGEDLSAVIAYGRSLFPDHLHIAIGFSLSANALLLLSAGIRGSVAPDVAIAVNGPIDLDHASRKLEKGLNRLYDWNFVRELKAHVRKNHGLKLGRIHTLRDFDAVYTAPAGGFQDRETYYRVCSSGTHLREVRIPTVLLTAEDDPFIDAKIYRSTAHSPSVLLHIERNGGHMGYLTRGGKRWLDQALKTYLEALLPEI